MGLINLRKARTPIWCTDLADDEEMCAHAFVQEKGSIAASLQDLRQQGKLSRSKIHRILRVNNVSLLLSMLCTANVSIRVERSNVLNSALMTGGAMHGSAL